MIRKKHILNNGQSIALQLRRSAKKNIIMRPVTADEISVNIPPFLSERKLDKWLSENEHFVLDLLQRAGKGQAAVRPESVWYRGMRHELLEHDAAFVALQQGALRLPRGDWAAQKKHLSRYLRAHAEEMLLPRLMYHAAQTGLQPVAVKLSDAKTFWGVCRTRTGIRLNWRLIGAPDFVADYVCIHELCHLRHLNHSSDFWALVNRFTPYTLEAKNWLKRHGNELFVSG
ncbi:M48 family metallopeptidase [Neisseria sp. 83E34]|uniref:M48 family metallopeptidase n=1 Tax=Neisseria sp. 83E34 TaxID=1692264 RepID=UPI0006CE74A9|nr:SprT family zinc-dependent metalloprotease [Neisseria sp. 83E34]KPN71747.1 hypothetical protein AKG09_05545 [Neisseria sp. 83E34]